MRRFAPIVLACCGSSNPVAIDAPVIGDGPRADAARDAAAPPDTTIDAPPGTDGTPTRQPCTSNFGSALPASGTFGRLDGFLVAIVPPGSMSSCNDDDAHVHLQIRANNAIYDIAIDATDGATHVDDVHTGTLDVALPGAPWSEGFHPGESIDYPTLGVHAASLPLMAKAQIVSTLQADLATANHVSIFATTYGGGGAHLVHRNGGNHDGLLVTEPLSTPAHLRMFSFTDQSF